MAAEVSGATAEEQAAKLQDAEHAVQAVQ
eukprot:SAG25_NODE_5969_length_601_cov_0.480080_1_plen_28_part_10